MNERIKKYALCVTDGSKDRKGYFKSMVEFNKRNAMLGMPLTKDMIIEMTCFGLTHSIKRVNIIYQFILKY